MIFRGSIPHPMQSLCTLRSCCHQQPRNARYQADATPYLGRTVTGWIAPACGWRTYSINSSASNCIEIGTSRPSALTVSQRQKGDTAQKTFKLKLSLRKFAARCSEMTEMALATSPISTSAAANANRAGPPRNRRGKSAWACLRAGCLCLSLACRLSTRIKRLRR